MFRKHLTGASALQASVPNQIILAFQHQTIQAMYKVVAEALAKTRSGDTSATTDPRKPWHYLNFYCLGNREAYDSPRPEEQGCDSKLLSSFFSSISTAIVPAQSSQAKPREGDKSSTSRHALVVRNRRFMVYVHSKLMIVDDEYAIVGAPLLVRLVKVGLCVPRDHLQ